MPRPPVPLGRLGERIARGSDALGWHWWPSDSAIATREHAGRAPCVNLGPCITGCAQGAKGSTDVTYWPITQRRGVRIATPLLLVVALVGITDVIFAVDSIPAIFAVTTDPLIVLTSNIFAILGLRAMYFLLAAVAAKFHLLSYGLAVILVFIGSKMLLVDVVKIPVLLSLGVVVTVLAVTMLWSVKTAPRPAGGARTASAE